MKGGVYVICDGGYITDPAFMCPMAARYKSQDVYWSEWLESVRKDVECCFGTLKNRFQILLKAMEFHEVKFIEKKIHMCCILHNMILTVNGLDIQSWVDEEVWKNLNPNAEDDDSEIALKL